VQLFPPGIPQLYYVGLLAGVNDMALLERTGVGRDINRHRYTAEEVQGELHRPVVRDLIELIRLRNDRPAFHGEVRVGRTSEQVLALRWQAGDAHAELIAEFDMGRWTVRHGERGAERASTLGCLGPQWRVPEATVAWSA
jgi:sucrose phosphorylase